MSAAAENQVRVLVCDDSAFMRRAISKMLERENDIVVVGNASTGEEGVAMARSLRPDVVTMDVEMPGMGGIEALRAIVKEHLAPVIMVSSLTREGAETTLHALEIGAVDFIPKPDSAFIDILKVGADLVAKVRHFGRRKPARPVVPRPSSVFTPGVASRPAVAPAPAPPRPPVAPSTPVSKGRFEIVAIGTSTGGPVALSQIVPRIPAGFRAPIVIVQHMPPGFTKPLADRLNAASAITVAEAEDGMLVRPGTALIAPAGKQIRLRKTAGGAAISLEADHSSSLHVPSVDALTASAGELFGPAALGVILTGMGSDGVEGLRILKSRGGYVVGQDEASSVVYGMPRAAAAAGLVDRVVALDEVPRTLTELTGSPSPA